MQRQNTDQGYLFLGKMTLYWILLLVFSGKGFAQSNISFQCNQLHLTVSQTLGAEPVTEDDPNFLSEAYSYLIAYYPVGKQDINQHLELRFPSKVGTYHWTQARVGDKNDSLYAWLLYNVDPKTYGRTIEAYPKDFTITITRYDDKKGGIVEGEFEGMMEAQLAWNNQTVSIPVKGGFQTTRTGKSGGDCRKQRKSEKEIITKAVAVFDKVLMSPLQKTDWTVSKKGDGLQSHIAINPAPFRPLFLCGEFFELKLTLNPASAYGKMIMDSLNFYNKQLTTNRYDSPEFKKASENLSRLQNFHNAEIFINANSPYIKEDYTVGSKDHSTVLSIPGVAYAWQYYQTPNKKGDQPAEKTMLFFGNWSGVNMHSGHYVPYPFVHKQQSPFIENFVVTIKAPASVANDLIKKIDWTKLNEGLTK